MCSISANFLSSQVPACLSRFRAPLRMLTFFLWLLALEVSTPLPVDESTCTRVNMTFDLEGEVLDAMQMMLLSSGTGDQYATGCRGPPCSNFYAHSSRLMLHPKQGSRVVTSLSPVQAIVLTRRERIKQAFTGHCCGTP